MRRACDWMSRGERGRRRELSAGAPRVPRARPVPRVERGVLRVQPVAREAALEARRTQPVPREVPEAPRRAPRARPVPRDAPLVPRVPRDAQLEVARDAGSAAGGPARTAGCARGWRVERSRRRGGGER